MVFMSDGAIYMSMYSFQLQVLDAQLVAMGSILVQLMGYLSENMITA